MAIKPMLFDTEMVRAILDGRKSCTRRRIPIDIVNNCDVEKDGTLLAYENCDGDFIEPVKLCQYQPGDTLYVQETWCALPVNEAGHIRGHSVYYYKADGDLRPEGWRGKWKPSIHMPKEAARIWLKVTDVRAERLQDITGQDVLKEGLNSHVHPKASYFDMNQREMFENLWNSTIKKSDLDRYGWDASPWVWVIEFERCEKPEIN